MFLKHLRLHIDHIIHILNDLFNKENLKGGRKLQDEDRQYAESAYTRQIFHAFHALLSSAEDYHDHGNDTDRNAPYDLLPVCRLLIVAGTLRTNLGDGGGHGIRRG